MGAFRGAVDVGVHAVETDVHLSKDGVVVLSHVSRGCDEFSCCLVYAQLNSATTLLGQRPEIGKTRLERAPSKPST